MIRLFALAAVAAAAALSATPAAAQDARGPLTIVTWGGAYTASQMRAYVNPFRETSDRWVKVETYAGGLEEVRRQVASLNVTWDVVDLNLSDAVRGCREGLLETIPTDILPPAPDGTPAAEDFLEAALQDCAIGQNVFATVIGYDPNRLPRRPDSVAAFFNTDDYPGKRGVRSNPRVVLEWALLADGVAPEDVYATLGTDDGLERAFNRLDSLRGNIVWWDAPDEAVDLLDRGRVVMTQTYNGRVQDAMDRGADYEILWDGAVRDVELWGIPKGSRDREDALDFIAFASQPARMAEQARHIAYGPVRESALAMLSQGERADLPTAQENARHALWADEQWWAENQARINARMIQWRQGGPLMTPLKGTAR
ncbi:ABC transporter substrate-binding protein [Caenispirillum salinarum]|uniref:ABC transporter substrate-binding protein n=1 Tax=Caenispirillum salinarum TaxID=859058 RepID=UPI00384FBB60